VLDFKSELMKFVISSASSHREKRSPRDAIINA